MFCIRIRMVQSISSLVPRVLVPRCALHFEWLIVPRIVRFVGIHFGLERKFVGRRMSLVGMYHHCNVFSIASWRFSLSFAHLFLLIVTVSIWIAWLFGWKIMKSVHYVDVTIWGQNRKVFRQDRRIGAAAGCTIYILEVHVFIWLQEECISILL